MTEAVICFIIGIMFCVYGIGFICGYEVGRIRRKKK